MEKVGRVDGEGVEDRWIRWGGWMRGWDGWMEKVGGWMRGWDGWMERVRVDGEGVKGHGANISSSELLRFKWDFLV